MNRYEKEKLIVGLRGQGKTYREIAREAQVSIRDIKPTLDKYGTDIGQLNENSVEYPVDAEGSAIMAVSSRAYELFSKGQDLLQVSIAVNIEGPKVIGLYKEYVDMVNLRIFSKLCVELGNEMPSLIKLYKDAKRKGISSVQILQYLTTFSTNLPRVQKQYDELENKIRALRHEQSESEKQLRDLEYKIEVAAEYQRILISSLTEIENEKWDLDRQKSELLRFVAKFRDSDEGYREIKQTVGMRVGMILTDTIRLLDIALIAVLVSLGNEPDKCKHLFEMLNLENNSLQKSSVTGQIYHIQTNRVMKSTPLMKAKKNPFFFPKGLLGAQIIGNNADPTSQRYRDELVAMSKMVFDRLKQDLTMDVMKLLENSNKSTIV